LLLCIKPLGTHFLGRMGEGARDPTDLGVGFQQTRFISLVLLPFSNSAICTSARSPGRSLTSLRI
jgi:hypothetical protein